MQKLGDKWLKEKELEREELKRASQKCDEYSQKQSNPDTWECEFDFDCGHCNFGVCFHGEKILKNEIRCKDL